MKKKEKNAGKKFRHNTKCVGVVKVSRSLNVELGESFLYPFPFVKHQRGNSIVSFFFVELTTTAPIYFALLSLHFPSSMDSTFSTHLSDLDHTEQQGQTASKENSFSSLLPSFSSQSDSFQHPTSPAKVALQLHSLSLSRDEKENTQSYDNGNSISERTATESEEMTTYSKLDVLLQRLIEEHCRNGYQSGGKQLKAISTEVSRRLFKSESLSVENFELLEKAFQILCKVVSDSVLSDCTVSFLSLSLT